MENNLFLELDKAAHMYANGLAPSGCGVAYKMALHAAYIAGGKFMHERIEQNNMQHESEYATSDND